jgi:endonuclease-3 related protein
VEKTLRGLRTRGLLSYRRLAPLSVAELAPLLRSSGTFRVKARRVKAFLDFLGSGFGGRASALRHARSDTLRRALLAVSGIGPETADCIVLYAAGQPTFVVDAYTRRIFRRLGHLRGDETYEEVRSFFRRALPADPEILGDYHAQLVRLAKEACRVKPLCDRCPLDRVCRKRLERKQRPRSLY